MCVITLASWEIWLLEVGALRWRFYLLLQVLYDAGPIDVDMTLLIHV